MLFKGGVSIFGLREEMFFAMRQIDDAAHWLDADYQATCTSAVDGHHSRNSLHYDGRAIDIRTFDLPPDVSREQYARLIRQRLSSDYDVVVEPDHIHVEWQPKRTPD